MKRQNQPNAALRKRRSALLRQLPPLQSILRRRADLRLVMIGGRPVVADPDLADLFAIRRVEATSVRLDGRAKTLDAAIAGRVRRATIREPGLDVPA